MKAVVIGGSGHIGTYLIPRLVEAGYEVVNVSRGASKPYTPNGAWNSVESVILDRGAEEKNGTFGQKIADLKGDIVIDLISFNFSSTKDLVDALKGNVGHFLFCSSIWAHGHATILPATEDLPRHPFGDYGINKAKSEAYLHEQYRQNGFPETVVMPGHITGPGWNCINPAGNLDPMIIQKIGRGEEIILPHFGMEMVHHVHADDVAQVFMKAITYRGNALGESFHAVAPQAMSLLGFAEAMYRWFGKEEKISFLPWKEWCEYTKDESYINGTNAHISHSDNYSIEKGRMLIDYRPRYTILQAVYESVTSMIERGVIQI